MGTHISKAALFAMTNPSSIREIMNIVTDFEEHPEKYPRPLIYFGGGWPQDPPPPPLKRALLEVVEDDDLYVRGSRYGATRGQPYFIRNIVKYEKEIFGRPVDPEEIIVGMGSTELTAAFIRVLVDPGDEVILPNPSYLNYERQLKLESLLKVRIKRWRFIRWGGFNPSLESLERLVSRRTKMVILTTPGNPDSQVLSDDIVEGVLDLAEDYGFWVLIDVAYRGFIYTDTPNYFLRARREREIIMASFSKELRIPGWRLSYAIADRELVHAVETMEQAFNLCPNRLVQETLNRVFSNDEYLAEVKKYIEDGRRRYAKVARLTYRLFRRLMPGIKALRPQGGFYLFFNHSRYVESSKKFCEMLLKKWQVALAPGVDFGMEGWTRLSYAPLSMDRRKLEEGVWRIASFVGELGK